ncbi:MAG TPA: hypothetical protein DCQ28_12660 [Bacteroidetes bacterium]|nr:hypothetical protein [Bacteroidota bacterium]
MKSGRSFKTVDEYLSEVPAEQRAQLEQIRSTIKKLVPDAVEKISYNMPMFYLGGMFAGFAAFKNHCSYFPCSGGVLKNFSKELSSYKTSKGTIHFTFDHPIPATLLKKIIALRLSEIELRNKKKGTGYSASKKSKILNFDIPKNIGKPAERALANAKISNLKQLSKWSEKEVAELHGIGPKAVGILRGALETNKLSFFIK